LSTIDQIAQTLRQASFWQDAAPAIAAARGLIEASPAPANDQRVALVNALSEAGARIFVGADKTLNRQAFSLAPLFQRAGCVPTDAATWQSFSERLLTMLAELRQDDSALSVLLRLLVAEGIALSPSQALVRFINRVSTMERAALKEIFDTAEDIGQTLSAAGWFNVPTDGVAGALRSAVNTICQQDDISVRVRFVQLLMLLGFVRTTPTPWLTMVMNNFVYPFLDKPIHGLQRIDLTLLVESLVYHMYVKKVETAEHFRDVYAHIKLPLVACGRSLRPHLKPFPEAQGSPLPIGFFLPSAAVLAHTQNFITFLRGLVQLDPRPIEPIIYVLGPPLKSIDIALRPFGFKMVYLWADKELPPLETYVNLHHAAKADAIGAMIFISNVTGMCFTTAMGVAPVHIWWSMKYRGLTLPDLDGYMDMSRLFEQRRVIEGTTWYGCHAALPPLTDPAQAPLAAEIRASSGVTESTLILGCIGREEKLLNRDYVRALGEIMRRCPNTEYIWTGREQPPEFLAWLVEEGIADRCTFIGWVDTKLYAHVLDIFVDSFPFASGHTAFEAMALGKPIVVLLTPEALETSTASAVVPVFEGHAGTEADQIRVREIFTAGEAASLLPFVRNVEEYIDQAQRLINDTDFRANVGRAGQIFVEEFMRDEVRLAKSTCQNILDIINQAQAK